MSSWMRDMNLMIAACNLVFQRSGVLAEGDIQVTDYSQELSGFLRWTWKLAFRRAQQDTLDIISCRRMIEYRRGVFYVFVLINNRGALLLIPIREICEIRGLITSNHMGWYGCGTMGMGSHEAGCAVSYLCTRNQEEKKIRILER